MRELLPLFSFEYGRETSLTSSSFLQNIGETIIRIQKKVYENNLIIRVSENTHTFDASFSFSLSFMVRYLQSLQVTLRTQNTERKDQLHMLFANSLDLIITPCNMSFTIPFKMDMTKTHTISSSFKKLQQESPLDWKRAISYLWHFLPGCGMGGGGIGCPDPGWGWGWGRVGVRVSCHGPGWRGQAGAR